MTREQKNNEAREEEIRIARRLYMALKAGNAFMHLLHKLMSREKNVEFPGQRSRSETIGTQVVGIRGQ